MRIARALVAALLIGLMSVTPLSAVLEPGRHETRLPAWSDNIRGVPVVLDDRTGRVAGIGLVPATLEDGVSNPAGNDRMLLVNWVGGACDHAVSLLFEHTNSGYRLAMRTDRASGCILVGVGRAVVLRLRSPVDAATVRLEDLSD